MHKYLAYVVEQALRAEGGVTVREVTAYHEKEASDVEIQIGQNVYLATITKVRSVGMPTQARRSYEC
jgi:hypothetical protein